MQKNENQSDWLEIYAIYDKKSEAYDTPFFAHNEIFAKRRYILMAEEDRSPLRMWPNDFELHRVGRFNIKTACVIEENQLVLEGASVHPSEWAYWDDSKPNYDPKQANMTGSGYTEEF